MHVPALLDFVICYFLARSVSFPLNFNIFTVYVLSPPLSRCNVGRTWIFWKKSERHFITSRSKRRLEKWGRSQGSSLAEEALRCKRLEERGWWDTCLELICLIPTSSMYRDCSWRLAISSTVAVKVFHTSILKGSCFCTSIVIFKASRRVAK